MSAGRFDPRAEAAELDATDPLVDLRERFTAPAGVTAYLDGNSLGRPLRGTSARVAAFLEESWGGRLIRGWEEGWLAEPERVGDELGRIVLGAAAGQTIIGDSTSVLLYKAIRAAVAARPHRREIVCSAADFPTDRFLLQGIAAELGLTLRAIRPAVDGGPTLEQVEAMLGERTAAVVLSHVAFRSAYLSDAAAITAAAHHAGALVVWDLSHSAAVVPIELDRWEVDLAVGCSYKYLNGGPGSPAFLFARADLIPALHPPIQGWLGSARPFEMGERYAPAEGVRRFVSGTPPIIGMLAMTDMLALLEEAGLARVRAKSERLTAFVVDVWAETLVEFDVRLASPREPELRGSHVTLDHPAFADIVPALQARGVIPDFRRPHGLRLGLSPLSTSFAEIALGLDAVRAELLARM